MAVGLAIRLQLLDCNFQCPARWQLEWEALIGQFLARCLAAGHAAVLISKRHYDCLGVVRRKTDHRLSNVRFRALSGH